MRVRDTLRVTVCDGSAIIVTPSVDPAGAVLLAVTYGTDVAAIVAHRAADPAPLAT